MVAAICMTMLWAFSGSRSIPKSVKRRRYWGKAIWKVSRPCRTRNGRHLSAGRCARCRAGRGLMFEAEGQIEDAAEHVQGRVAHRGVQVARATRGEARQPPAVALDHVPARRISHRA